MIDFSLMESDTEKVSYLKEIGQYIENGVITVEKINEALANYFTISSWLTTVLESIEKENNKIKTDYKVWYSKKFIETKNNMSVNLGKSLKLSQGEIEYQMIVDNKEEYKEWQNKLSELERSEGFYRRLCQNFETQGKMLIQLSQNQRSEMIALSVENRANKDITKTCMNNHIKIKKVRLEN